MKQLLRLLLVGSVLLTASCTKTSEIIQDPQALRTDKCQLQSIVWDDGYALRYTYNSQGLVESWIEDYYGDLYVATFTYNDQGKPVSFRNVWPDGNVYINQLHYEGGKVVRQTAVLEGTTDLLNDTRITYNSRGQTVSYYDVVQDVQSDFFYNPRGDFIRNDFYVGGSLVYRIEYSYLFENRNAFLALPGIDTWWTSYNVPVFGPRWDATTKITYYEGTDEYVLADYDPAQSAIETGHRNYITWAAYYDRASETPGEINFTYANCGPKSAVAGRAPNVKKSGAANMVKKINRMLSVNNRDLKKEIVELKNEVRGDN